MERPSTFSKLAAQWLKTSLLSASVITFTHIANADIKYIQDENLSDYAGQAGLSLDLSFIDNLTEFDYVEMAFPNLPGLLVGGHGNDGSAERTYYTEHLDNIRINISLAESNAQGDQEEYEYGFSQMRNLAQAFLKNGNTNSKNEFEALASGYDPLRDHLEIDDKKTYDEGDLVIHLNYLDPFEKEGGAEALNTGEGLTGMSFAESSIEEADALSSRAVDFKYSINDINMAFTSNTLGNAALDMSTNPRDFNANQSNASSSTRLMSQFSMQGYLGPHDLHLQEFGDSERGSQTGITWNSYFRVTDLDVYLDIAGIRISDVKIHNDRGDLSGINLETDDGSTGKSSFGFAHAQREIYSLTEENFESYEVDPKKKKKRKGIAFNTRFKGDIDIGNVSFGDTATSLGSYYYTDFYFNRKLTISPRD